MLKLVIPPALEQEFATVESLWRSDAETRRVDSLLLSWVKYEKQLRRLFCFLVYQHPGIQGAAINAVITMLAQNNRLYPRSFIRGIEALGTASVSSLVGPNYARLASEIATIEKYRNKLIHGQVTGLAVRSPQLERNVRSLIEWVSLLADGADRVFGYDGLQRNTFKQAKAAARIVVTNFPFSSPKGFEAWLKRL
jgi:hypothetical protein